MKDPIVPKMEKFKLFWRNCLFQTLLATLTMFAIILVLTIEHAVIISSLGSTVFLLFAMPRSATARPRNVIGGYLSALLSGSLCSSIPHPSLLHSIAVYSLAVGLSFAMMVVTRTEHPPAAGAALGIAMTGFSPNTILTVALVAMMISLIHFFLKPILRDLTQSPMSR